MKSWTLVLVALLGASLLLAGEARADSEIVVTGRGLASVMPDRARIEFSIYTTGKTTQEAASLNSERLERVLSVLQGAGFERKEIYTSLYTVDEVRDPKKSEKIRGYRAKHRLYIKIDKIEDVSRIVDLINQSGGVQVGRISYTSSQYDEVRRKALAIAVENARKDARVMASAAGGKLGALIELTTHFPDNPTFQRSYKVEACALRGGVYPSTSIVPSELNVHVTVLGRWIFISDTPGEQQENK